MVAHGPRAVGLALFRVDEHEVDVGRDVEFASPQFAHAYNVQLLADAACFANRLAVARGEPAVQMPERVLDRDFGEGSRGLQHLGQRRKPSQIAGDEPQHGLPAQQAEHSP